MFYLARFTYTVQFGIAMMALESTANRFNCHVDSFIEGFTTITYNVIGKEADLEEFRRYEFRSLFNYAFVGKANVGVQLEFNFNQIPERIEYREAV